MSSSWDQSHLTKLYCSAKQMEQCKAVGEKTGIEPIEYKLTVHNAFRMPREYTVYYVIVPPMND